MNLTEFLLARIAEDEETARFASGDRWDRLTDGDPKFRKVVAWGLTPIGAMNAEQDADHIAHWDPARVLAECEAKRRIVGTYLGSRAAMERMADPIKQALGEAMNLAHGDALKALALPYADHPDYDPEWRP